MLAGQLPMTGGCVSLTVIVNEHCVPLRAEVQVTVVAPTGKNDPDGGSQFAGSDPQFPDGGGIENVTTAPHAFGSLFTVLFAGHVIAHVEVLTVTVKLQVGPELLVQVTVVVPTGKLEPEPGLQVTVAPEHAVGSW